MESVTREQVPKMQKRDAILVEVLPEKAYRDFHLPGAINVPLDDEFDRNIQSAVPDKYDPVIVYCQNKTCDASPKAAERMDELGYVNVYDYEAGKDDWKSAGLPIE